jgi:hypothetical protein
MQVEHTEMQDWEFEKRLLEQQHKQLLAALKDVATALGRVEKSNADVSSSISQNATIIQSFIKKVGELTAPNVSLTPNIAVNQEGVIAEIAKLSSELKACLEKPAPVVPVQKEAKEWKFDIIRNHGGVITSITAKQK